MSKPVSLRRFMLQALLWLPLAFFFWFLWAAAFVIPVAVVTDWILTGLYPGQFHDVLQQGYLLEVEVLMALPPEMQRAGQGQPVIAIPVNPTLYGYGLPLLAGLVISTPQSIGRRAAQIAVGALAIIAVQIWGSVWDTLQTLQFQLGAEGAAVIAQMGLSAEQIALAYQMGYLILPGVVPIIVWVLLNRPFIEGLMPATPGSGRTDKAAAPKSKSGAGSSASTARPPESTTRPGN